MARKRKTKVKINRDKIVKSIVLVVLFGIIFLAVMSPQTLSQIENKFGINISDYIKYENSISTSKCN